MATHTQHVNNSRHPRFFLGNSGNDRNFLAKTTDLIERGAKYHLKLLMGLFLVGLLIARTTCAQSAHTAGRQTVFCRRDPDTNADLGSSLSSGNSARQSAAPGIVARTRQILWIRPGWSGAAPAFTEQASREPG